MDRAGFWALVDRIDADALRDGDEERALSPLREALAGVAEVELEGFEEQLARALYALDTRAHADHAGKSGRSGDGFLYVRCYVVARGEAHHQRVLADPTAMPTSLDEWCESLLYVARDAWAKRSGGDASEWPFDPSVSYESYSNAAGWA